MNSGATVFGTSSRATGPRTPSNHGRLECRVLVGDEGPDIILDVAVKLIELDLVVLVTPFLVGLAIFEPLDHVVEEHTMAAAEIGILPGASFSEQEKRAATEAGRGGEAGISMPPGRPSGWARKLVAAGVHQQQLQGRRAARRPLYSSSKSMNRSNCLRARFASIGQKKLRGRGFSSGFSAGISIKTPCPARATMILSPGLSNPSRCWDGYYEQRQTGCGCAPPWASGRSLPVPAPWS